MRCPMRHGTRAGSAWRSAGVVAVLLALAVPAGPAAAEAPGFAALFARPATGLAARCRNGLLQARIARWRRRDRPTAEAYPSVAAIMDDVIPPAIRALEDEGCGGRYIRSFLACTTLDWPEDAPLRLEPTGVSAETEAAMAEVMRGCLDRLDREGIVPGRL